MQTQQEIKICDRIVRLSCEYEYDKVSKTITNKLENAIKSQFVKLAKLSGGVDTNKYYDNLVYIKKKLEPKFWGRIKSIGGGIGGANMNMEFK